MNGRVANIGPHQRNRRLVAGLVMLGLGVGLVVALIAKGAAPGWLLTAIVPFWAGALGLIQARERT
jgi:hypothetical protein